MDTSRRLDTSRPFTRAQARAAGISARRLRGPRFRVVLGDVFVAADAPADPDERIVAALLVHDPGARASHHSAAVLYDAPVPRDDRVHVSVEAAEQRRWRPGLMSHVSPPGIETWTRRGLPVSPPDRLMVEMAALLGLVDLVVLGDALIRRVGWSAAELRRALADCSSYWSEKARLAAELVRDHVDSAMETRLRLLLVLAGLPEPVVDWHIVDRDGVILRRLDLAFVGARVAVEYDGRHHVERVSTWEDDVEREAELREELGWIIVKVTARGVYADPARTVARVAAALRSRGVVLPPLTEDYRLHFPGHAARARGGAA